MLAFLRLRIPSCFSALFHDILQVLTEILDDLELGQYEIKLNHRGLLDSMLDIAGVPEEKFRPICSAIDKLDKEPWEAVRKEMVVDKGLDELAADAIKPFVELRGAPKELLKTLLADGVLVDAFRFWFTVLSLRLQLTMLPVIGNRRPPIQQARSWQGCA